MKKVSYLLSIALLAAGISSCAKTNTRKVSGDWKVTAEDVVIDHSMLNTSYSERLLADGTMITATWKSNSSNAGLMVYSASGPISTNELNIKKDGTWTREREYLIDELPSYMLYRYTASGTWSFIGKSKSDDIDKNERMLFNTLSETNYQVQVVKEDGTQFVQDNTTKTYVSGEKNVVYVVKASGKKSLRLETEGSEPANPDYGFIVEGSKLSLEEK